MNQTKQKRKWKGWLIALIIVAVIFAAGAICCNTIGRAQAGSLPQISAEAAQ